MDSLWKLAWALPLVLVIGLAAVLALRRVIPPPAAVKADAPLVLDHSLPLSEGATAHLLRVEGEAILVVVATGGVVAAPIRAANAAPGTPRTLRGIGRS